MFDKSILSLGLATALVVGLAGTPVKAEPVGAVVAAGFVGAVFGAGLASLAHRDEGRIVETGYAYDYGAPGWQRPVVAGPGRHRVCGWQDRYDRHERYVGSRRICWIEAW